MHGRAPKWNYYIETTGAQVQHVARGALPCVCIDACGRRDRKTTTYTHSTGMREISRRNRTNKTKMLWLRGWRELPCRPIAVGWSTELPARGDGETSLAASPWQDSLSSSSCCRLLYYNFARIGSGWRMALNCTPRQGQDISRTQSAACRRVGGCSIPARVHSTSWALMCALPPPPLESCRRIHTCSSLVSLPAASGCVRGHATKLRSGLAFAMWQCSSANTTGHRE